MDRETLEWLEAMKAKGHMPILDPDGSLNIFVYEEGDYHFGPGCEACGWSDCMYCLPISEIPQCTAVEAEVIRERKAIAGPTD